MTFPHVDRKGPHPFIVTGRYVHADGSFGAMCGYSVREADVERELERLRKFSEPAEPEFSKAALDRKYGISKELPSGEGV